MSQLSFSDAEFAGKRKVTRRERFLAEMERAIPWKVFAELIEPHYPKAGRGRRPYPVVVGERWSKAKCDEVERHVVLETQRALQKCVTAAVPQSVFDALTSHAHNFGWPSTCASQAVQAINRGDIQTGCDRLAYGPDGRPVWAYVGTKYIQGLHNRRKAERKLCLSGIR